MSVKQNLKQVATRFNLSQEKLKTICISLFDYIPDDFTDEQIGQIQVTLTSVVTDVKALTSSVQQQIQQGELATQSDTSNPMVSLYQNCQHLATQPQKIQEIKQILGQRTISKNVEFWLDNFGLLLRKTYARQAQMLVSYQAASKQMINETIDTMNSEVAEALMQSNNTVFKMVTDDISDDLRKMSQVQIDLSKINTVYDARINEILTELSQRG
jgi:hypothetical protein